MATRQLQAIDEWIANHPELSLEELAIQLERRFPDSFEEWWSQTNLLPAPVLDEEGNG